MKYLFVLICGIGSCSVIAGDDPTAPLNWTEPKIKAETKVRKSRVLPSLQSIICEENGRSCYAIISNKIVSTGETVSGYKVKKITPENVEISRGGKQWNLGLFPLDLKQ